jgi:hypothetical protein
MKEFKAKKNVYRTLRKRNKSIRHEGFKCNISYDITGGVINMPNVTEGIYLKFLKDNESKIVFTRKSPKEGSKDNHVGIELEFLCKATSDKLGLKLYEAGVGKYVTLKTDPSIKCSHESSPSDCGQCNNKIFSHELCIIVNEVNYKDVMKSVCEVLNKEDAVINKSCGMHVHIDCRNRDAEKVYQNLFSSQNVLLRMNPKSRIEKWAKKNDERDFKIASNGHSRDDRYYAINAMAFQKYGSIEIRVHSGTVDYTKITNWVSLLVSIANCSERYVRSFNTIKTFCTRFSISETLQTYIEERISKFKIVIDEVSGSEMIPEAERGVA